jgi:hypothetical protein
MQQRKKTEGMPKKLHNYIIKELYMPFIIHKTRTIFLGQQPFSVSDFNPIEPQLTPLPYYKKISHS